MEIYNNKTHPIIKNDDTYFLDKKVVTFHSEDRDIKKWPNSNEFEVSLPESFQNIQSMRLLSMNLNDDLPVFSNKYRNTKLSFALGAYDENTKSNIHTIIIHEGTYTPVILASTIQSLMNAKVGGVNFICKYDMITKKMYFSCDVQFHLRFDLYHEYNDVCYNEYIFQNNTSNWGLPYMLGYDRKVYDSVLSTDLFCFLSLTRDSSIRNDNIQPNKYFVEFTDTNPVNIKGETCFYMELDKYNVIDEILPDSNKRKTLSVNNGKVNAVFAQIPLNKSFYEQIFECKNNYNPPIKNISKLKFKFRFHDGKLVDFKNINFSFMIEFNTLTNEQRRNTFIRSANIL